MKKTFLLLGAAVLLLSNPVHAQIESIVPEQPKPDAKTMKQSIHQYKAETLSGETFDFSTLAGKKVLVVNTASECGFTPQYKELEAIYRKYGKNLVIVGFPTNDFGGQEPGNNKQIASFCEKNYGVTFPMMAKITVKGKKMDPVYQFLTKKNKNGLQDSEVEWNFQKYLLNEKGELEKVLASKVKPTDAEIISWIEGK
jgi:glutathione peroxidase